MDGNHKEDVSQVLTVLAVNADEFCTILDNREEGRLKIVKVSDFSTAMRRFHLNSPALVICGIDENAGEFNLLFRLAARTNIPVIVVANSKEAVVSLEGIRHIVDRREVEAVVNLAQKLLVNPLFGVHSTDSYPPPPKATDAQNYEPTSQKVSSNSKMPVTNSVSPLELSKGFDVSVEAVESQHKISNVFADRLSRQSEMILELQKQLNELTQETRNSVTDNGLFINAVAAEGAEFYAELKSMIKAVAAKSDRTIDEIYAVLKDPSAKMQPADRQIEVNMERISLSAHERNSQIDALQAAITNMEGKGTEREFYFQDRIDDLLSQITGLSSVPPKPDSGIGKGELESLSLEIESRFADIEIAIARLGRSVGAGEHSENFAGQFEDLWDTQIVLKKLESRVKKLEQRSSELVEGRTSASSDAVPKSDNLEEIEELKKAQLSIKNHLAGMDRRFSAFEAALTELEQQSKALSKSPQTIIASFEERLSGLESKLSKTEPLLDTNNKKDDQTKTGTNAGLLSLEIRFQQMEAMMKELEKTIKKDTMVQHSIRKTSSVPPAANREPISTIPPIDSARATLIGVDAPKTKGKFDEKK